MYRVSPQLFVTNEHIISESSSTPSPSGFSSSSSCVLSRFSLVPFFDGGSGDAIVLRGVEPLGSFSEACEGDVGPDVGACDALCAC